MTVKFSILLLTLICFAVVIPAAAAQNTSANIDSTRAQIVALADKGDLTEMDTAVNKLISDYAGSTQLDQNLFIIADSFTWRRLYERSDRLYHLVLDKSKDSSLTTKARLGLERTKALRLIGEEKKYSAAQEVVNSMVVTFKQEPDLATALFQIGQEFGWQRRYIEAGDAFSKGTGLFPNSPASKEMKLWSTRAGICALIGKLNSEQIKDDEIIAAIDKMIKDFEGDKGLPEAVQWISKEYEWVKGTSNDRTGWYDVPNSVYQKLVRQFGDSAFGQDAEWDQKRLTHRMKIFDLIKESDQKNTDAAIEKMVVEFAGRAELAGELRWVAIGYEENPETTKKAKELYDRIAREYPGTIEANNSVLDSRRIDIDTFFKADNDAEAELLLEKFVKDFNSNEYAGPCLKSMAWRAYIEGIEFDHLKQTDKARMCYERAIRIWNIILDKLPQNPLSTPESLYFVGETYSRLGQCDRAIPYLKRVVLDWPDYKFAYKADTEIAICLQKLPKQ